MPREGAQCHACAQELRGWQAQGAAAEPSSCRDGCLGRSELHRGFSAQRVPSVNPATAEGHRDTQRRLPCPPCQGRELCRDPRAAGQPGRGRALPWAHTKARARAGISSWKRPRRCCGRAQAGGAPGLCQPRRPPVKGQRPPGTAGPGRPHRHPHARGPTLRRVPRNSSLAKARRGAAVRRPRAEGPARGRDRAARRARSSSSTALMAALGAP